MAQPTSISLLARRPLISYFVLAYALAWLLWLPLVLSKGGGIGLIPFTTPPDVSSLLTSLIIVIGSLGPALAAIIMSVSIGGWTEVKQLLRRMVQVRAGIQWYLVAIFVPLVASLLPVLLFGGSAVFLSLFSFQGAKSLLIYVGATFIDMVLGSPIGEEPGWRGFALPRLQQRYGGLTGSLILGPLWALWHLPLFLTTWGALYQSIGVALGLLLFTLTVMCYTIFITWLFNNTRGSIFLAILAHSAIDSRLVFFLVLFSQAAQAITTPTKSGAAAYLSGLLGLTITWAVIALLLIALTKGRLSYKLPVSKEVQAVV